VPFVPVDADALDAVLTDGGALRDAHRALLDAAERVRELADDYRRDAVRRLRERGASEAQVEGYERALGARCEELDRARRAAEAALAAVEERVRELRSG